MERSRQFGKRSIGKIIDCIVLLMFGPGLALGVSAEQPQQELRGRIRGVVLSAETGQPVEGAYVGVGEFGDSGGSNRSRHRELGWFAKTTTDAAGHFELDGLAFTDVDKRLDKHPLVVTHPEYLRYDQNVELRQDGGVPEVVVRLRRAATINVTVVDAQGKAVEGFWAIRLEALDGHRFLPPDRDPHMGSFAASAWLQGPRRPSQGFTFTTLKGGRYAVDVMQLKMVDKPEPPSVWQPDILYYGGVRQVDAKAGETVELRVAPQTNDTLLTIQLPEVSGELPADKLKQIPLVVLISRNLGLLMWDSDIAYGPEDERLGRLSKQALYYSLAQGGAFAFRNLPPGEYAVFGGPAYIMNAAKATLAKGQTATVQIPRIETVKQSSAPVWTLSRGIELERGNYTVEDLCERISTVTGSHPRLVADRAIAEEQITLPGGRMWIWDLLETLYLDKGYRVEEGLEKTLVVKR